MIAASLLHDASLRDAAALVESSVGDRELLTARLTWSALVEPGDAVAGALVAALGAVDALRALETAATGGLLPAVAGIAPGILATQLERWRPRLAPRYLTDVAHAAARAGLRLIAPEGAAWPERFQDLGAHAPLALWVRGDPAALGALERSVALVGARAATPYGEHVAGMLAAELAGEGVAIVSGGAYGIDGAAHRAALGAGGVTVAFVAGGADRVYPAGHGHLFARIAERGAIVGEVAPGGTPTKWRFLQRNRLIAAAGDATVVVEAGWRSGSLNTAGHAAALGRPLGAVPGAVTGASSDGCHRLLREFDATCVTRASDVRELLGDWVGAAEPVTADRPRPQVVRVLDSLAARTWRDAGEIARRSGMSLVEVQAELGLLELDGRIESSAGGWRLAR